MKTRWKALVGVVVLLGFARFFFWPSSPHIIPWAWEYPNDLRFMPRGSTVAYYAGLITVVDDQTIAFAPRRQPLYLPKNPKTIPVVRIENNAPGKYLTEENKTAITQKILGICAHDTQAIGCQVDFDAVESEYGWYASLIRDLKSGLPPNTPLSITALVSWCYPGSWFDQLGVQGIPMYFRMGDDDAAVRGGHVPADFLQAKGCRDTLGISLDEASPSRSVRHGRNTVYVFAPQGWTKADYHQASYILSH